MTGLRERKKVETRQRLMFTAIRLFSERGFDRVTVEDIAAEADVSPSTFFRYFDSKAGAVFGLAEHRIGEMSAAIEGRPAGTPVLSVVRDYWATQMEVIQANPDILRAQQKIADEYGHVAGERSRIYDVGRDMTTAALRAESPTRSAIEIEMLGSVIVSAVFTAVRLWYEDGGDLTETFDACWRLVERLAAP